MEILNTQSAYNAKDFKNSSLVKWCPGCGDHAVLNSLHKAMATLGVAPHQTVVVSGIGCSSRLPYYMNSYGFHSIHGRGAAIATGVKVANPDLAVWLVTGDGDCLAIGGNHFIHALRRNVDLNIVVINNKIYGLTKGQYSPTSPRGFVSKSSPFGTVEDPFTPAELVFGARGRFFARTLDVELQQAADVMLAAARHKGASVVESLTNCVIFNNGIHKYYSDRETRADRTIYLEHGKPMIFGKQKDKGIVLDGLELKVVQIGEGGVSEADLLVHDAHTESCTLHRLLALMGSDNDLPLALGVIRDVKAPTYDQAVTEQIREQQTKQGEMTLQGLLDQAAEWEVS